MPTLRFSRSKFPQPLQRLQNLRDLLGAFGGFPAKVGGEGFGVGAVGEEEFLDGGDLGGEGGGPGGRCFGGAVFR